MIDMQVKQPDEIVNRNVSMFVRNWAVVEEVNARFDFGNISSALRYIINEYVRLSTLESELLQNGHR
jgi:hypothetical protein